MEEKEEYVRVEIEVIYFDENEDLLTSESGSGDDSLLMPPDIFQ